MSQTIREALEDGGLFARKSLGQHFLLDLNLTAKIVRTADVKEGATVIEVGPGPGGLTQALLDSPAKLVIAIEKDRRFVAHLKTYFASYGDRLIVIEADALAVDEEALITEFGAQTPVQLVSNLPYNVGTPLLIKWLKAGDWRGSMCLMFQEEVARRIVALPGDPHYGRLAVLTSALANARIAMGVPRTAFTPPPKVESAIVVLDSCASPYRDIAGLEHITAMAFGQRRKMLRASLKGLGNAEALLNDAGIDPTTRPETLTPQEFFRLVDAWRAR